MRNTITLNGVESSTIPGLLIQELPAISKPLMRTEVETIDGRDGDITTDLGYSAYDKQISIGLFADYDIDQIIAYFNSKGTVIFSNEPEKFYNYEIVDQIDFERLVRYRTATVTMHCQPFKYSTTEGADILSTNSNFATLNQSLNTDTGFYTYSSNVQDDVTATRSSGTGGKFFAVFSVPVVQGVTYYFSGNVSKNVSMYGYTNQLRGTSAGISGKGFNGYFTYTATFTGTMVLGFYSSATTELFIRNFKVSNQITATVSGEGTNIVLENSAEAPFSIFDLKGNTKQDTYSGKNLFNKNTVTLGKRIGGDGLPYSDNNYFISDFIPVEPNESYISNVQYAEVSAYATYDSGKNFIRRSMGDGWYNISTDSNAAYIRIATRKNYLDTLQCEAGTTPTEYEQYVGGVPSPNPDYPQIVKTVSGQQIIKIGGGKNLFDKNTATSGYRIGSDGKPYSDNNYFISDFIPVKPNTEYWANKNNIANECAIATYDTNKTFISRKQGTSATNKTTESNAAYLRFATLKTVIEDAMLEEGSISPNYEPYIYKEYVLDLCTGKNLLDVSSLNGKTTANLVCTVASDGTIAISGSSGSSTSHFNFPYRISQALLGKKLTFSYNGTLGGVGNIGLKKADTNNISALGTLTNGVSSKTFTVTQEIIDAVGVLDIWINSNMTVDGSFTLQLEIGDSKSSYELYNGIEFCKINDYQDNIYKSDDKWYKNKKVGRVDLSTLSYTAAMTVLKRTTDIPNIKYVSSNQEVGSALAEKYIVHTGSGMSSVSLKGYFAVDTNAVAFNVGAGGADPTGLLYYALAEPETEEITSAILKDELDYLNQANAYRVRTRIDPTYGDAHSPFIIAAEVATDPSGTITNSGNIYSKPKLTIFGSGSIGVYLNNVQMFQIALGTNDYITIDTAIMEAYQDNLQTLKNRSVTGDYNNFKLPVGESEISFSGTVTMCVVENYSRWL